MNPIREQIEHDDPPALLRRATGIGLGSAALASLLSEAGLAGANRRPAQAQVPMPTGGLAGSASLRPQGEAGDLPVHERRPVADGPVRLQAQDGRHVRQGPARLDPHGPAADHDDQRPGPVPVAPSKYKFAQHGKSGTWVSELLPWTAKIVDEIALIKTVWTEAINHDPAVTFICTGHQLPGRASLGSWLSYGLGTRTRTCRRSW